MPAECLVGRLQDRRNRAGGPGRRSSSPSGRGCPGGGRAGGAGRRGEGPRGHPGEVIVFPGPSGPGPLNEGRPGRGRASNLRRFRWSPLNGARPRPARARGMVARNLRVVRGDRRLGRSCMRRPSTMRLPLGQYHRRRGLLAHRRLRARVDVVVGQHRRRLHLRRALVRVVVRSQRPARAGGGQAGHDPSLPGTPHHPAVRSPVAGPFGSPQLSPPATANQPPEKADLRQACRWRGRSTP